MPLVVISRFAAYGCKVHGRFMMKWRLRAGRLAVHLQSVQRGSRLWRRACAAGGGPSRCDKPWFCATFCGGDGNDRDGSESIWDCVKTASCAAFRLSATHKVRRHSGVTRPGR